MNLKNNYLLKKLLKWANKNVKNSNIYNVVFFFKKNKEKHLVILLYTCVPKLSMIWFTAPEIYRCEGLKLVALGHFCPFTPRKTKQIKILKKWKKLLEILSYTCVPKITIIWWIVPEIQSDTDRIFVILGHILPFYPLSQNFEKMKKAPGDVIILLMLTKNHNHIMHGSSATDRFVNPEN